MKRQFSRIKNVKMKAIKKPIPVEFVKLERTWQSITNAYEFINGNPPYELPCSHITQDKWDEYCNNIYNNGHMPLKTLESGEGTQNANFGDYILKGIDGEYWPVKPDIFERTYDVLSE